MEKPPFIEKNKAAIDFKESKIFYDQDGAKQEEKYPVTLKETNQQKSEQKIKELRQELGIEESESLAIFEGMSHEDFLPGQIEVMRDFYKKRRTREAVVDPTAHLEGRYSLITSIKEKVRSLRGKEPFTKPLDVVNENRIEARDDYSHDYLDVWYEVQPVFNTIKSSLETVLQQNENKGEIIRISVNKIDYKTLQKTVYSNNTILEDSTFPIEANTLWQALRRVNFEIVLDNNADKVVRNGGGGGDAGTSYATVKGNILNYKSALEELERIMVHEHTHAHQIVVMPEVWKDAFRATYIFEDHATHPTEIQARLHEAVQYANNNNTDMKAAISFILHNYLEDNKMPKNTDQNTFYEGLASLHMNYFNQHYSQLKTLYPRL